MVSEGSLEYRLCMSWRSIQARINNTDLTLFLGGILLIQSGDIVTTYLGVYEFGLAEQNPFLTSLLDSVGILGLIGVKLSLLSVNLFSAWLVSDSGILIKYCCLIWILGSSLGVISNTIVLSLIIYMN